MPSPCQVLLISGSLRSSSTNTAMLRTALAVAPAAVSCVLYTGLADLPAFNPDDDHDPLPPAVDALRQAIRAADALLFSTPEYAGALPGSFKNLLDWLIGDADPRSISEKLVAWVNVAPRGALNAHESLRKVLGFANACVVEPACAHLPVTAAQVGENGLVLDGDSRRGLSEVLTALGDAALAR